MADETNFDLGYNPLSSPEAVSVPSSPPDTVPANPSIQTSHSKSQHQSSKRFSKSTANERESIIDSSVPENTKKQTKYAVNLLKSWLLENKKSTDFEYLDIRDLNDILQVFYAEIRSSNGDFLSSSSYVCIRAGISRYLSHPPFNRTLNLTTDKDFTTSNKMFKSMLRKIKNEGGDKTTHYPVITEEDIGKLFQADSFDLTDPVQFSKRCSSTSNTISPEEGKRD